MKKERKRAKINKIQGIIILILTSILIITLSISFINYKKTEKKIQVKEVARELILTIELIGVNDSIEFESSDSIYQIKNENGEKLKAICDYKSIEYFDKIEKLTLDDAKKIINNEIDFDINKEGQFLNIEESI